MMKVVLFQKRTVFITSDICVCILIIKIKTFECLFNIAESPLPIGRRFRMVEYVKNVNIVTLERCLFSQLHSKLFQEQYGRRMTY